MSENDKKNEHGYGTTGHSWDGIEEWNNPMPRWWVWTFYITIIWGIGYTIAYPAWPLINSATRGVLGQNTRADVAAEIQSFADANAAINERLASTQLTEIVMDAELQGYAFNAGAAVFKTWCAQCHGSVAAGAKGYPNLLDNDWLWGGTIEEIHTSISHGIRNDEDPDAHFSQMPAFGEFLSQDEIDALANHVLAISGAEHDATLTGEGAALFADNCASCHMEDGTGDRTQGAPDLTDAIWLYGGDHDTLVETITNSRFGVMPAWKGRLSDAQVVAVSSYIHSLGGGE